MFMIHSSMWDVKGTIKHCYCQAHVLISFFNSYNKSHFRQARCTSHQEKWNNNFFVGRVAWSLNRGGGGGMWEHIVVFTFIGLPMAMALFTGIWGPILPNPQENSSFEIRRSHITCFSQQRWLKTLRLHFLCSSDCESKSWPHHIQKNTWFWAYTSRKLHWKAAQTQSRMDMNKK